MVDEKRLKLYSIGNFFLGLGMGLYYTFSRPYLGIDLGGGEKLVLLLTGLEYASFLLSVAWGALADSLGRRRMVLLAALSGPPIAALAATPPSPPLFVALATTSFFIMSFGWAPSVSAVVVDKERAGVSYAYYALSGGLGWGTGAAAAWPLSYIAGEKTVLASTGISLATAYLWLYALYPPEAAGGEKIPAKTIFKEAFTELKYLTLAVAMGTAGMIGAFNIYTLKLTAIVEELAKNYSWLGPRSLYGIVYGGLPVLLGAPCRPLAGKAVDKIGAARLYAASMTAYLAELIGIGVADGLPVLILWILPIYPFYDTSMYVGAARYLGRHEATSAGIVLTGESAAGLLMMTVSGLPKETVLPALYALIAASIPLALMQERKWRKTYMKRWNRGAE